MARIVSAEFMDQRALAPLRVAHDVLQDATRVDDTPRLLMQAASSPRPT